MNVATRSKNRPSLSVKNSAIRKQKLVCGSSGAQDDKDSNLRPGTRSVKILGPPPAKVSLSLNKPKASTSKDRQETPPDPIDIRYDLDHQPHNSKQSVPTNIASPSSKNKSKNGLGAKSSANKKEKNSNENKKEKSSSTDKKCSPSSTSIFNKGMRFSYYPSTQEEGYVYWDWRNQDDDYNEPAAESVSTDSKSPSKVIIKKCGLPSNKKRQVRARKKALKAAYLYMKTSKAEDSSRKRKPSDEQLGSPVKRLAEVYADFADLELQLLQPPSEPPDGENLDDSFDPTYGLLARLNDPERVHKRQKQESGDKANTTKKIKKSEVANKQAKTSNNLAVNSNMVIEPIQQEAEGTVSESNSEPLSMNKQVKIVCASTSIETTTNVQKHAEITSASVKHPSLLEQVKERVSTSHVITLEPSTISIQADQVTPVADAKLLVSSTNKHQLESTSSIVSSKFKSKCSTQHTEYTINNVTTATNVASATLVVAETANTGNVKVGADKNTVELISPLRSAFYQDDSMTECLIACSIQIEEECRKSQEKILEKDPVTLSIQESNVPKCPTENLVSCASSSDTILPRTSTPLRNSELYKKSLSQQAESSTSSIKHTRQVIATRNENKTTSFGILPRRSPRGISMSQRIVSHRRLNPSPRKNPVVTTDPDPNVDFSPGWMESIRMATSPLNTSLSGRSLSQSMADSKTRSARLPDNYKGINRTLFSHQITSQNKVLNSSNTVNKNASGTSSHTNNIPNKIVPVVLSVTTSNAANKTEPVTSSTTSSTAHNIAPVTLSLTCSTAIKVAPVTLSATGNRGNEIAPVSSSSTSSTAYKVTPVISSFSTNVTNITNPVITSNTCNETKKTPLILDKMNVAVSESQKSSKNNEVKGKVDLNQSCDPFDDSLNANLFDIEEIEARYLAEQSQKTEIHSSIENNTPTGSQVESYPGRRNQVDKKECSVIINKPTIINTQPTGKSTFQPKQALQAHNKICDNNNTHKTANNYALQQKKFASNYAVFGPICANKNNVQKQQSTANKVTVFAPSTNPCQQKVSVPEKLAGIQSSFGTTGQAKSITTNHQNIGSSQFSILPLNPIKVIPKILYHQTLTGNSLVRHKSAEFSSLTAVAKKPEPSNVQHLKVNGASPLVRHRSVGDFRTTQESQQKYSAEEIERKREEARQRLLQRKLLQQQQQQKF